MRTLCWWTCVLLGLLVTALGADSAPYMAASFVILAMGDES